MFNPPQDVYGHASNFFPTSGFLRRGSACSLGFSQTDLPLGIPLDTRTLQSSHFLLQVPYQTEIPSHSFLPTFRVLVELCSVWGYSNQVSIIVSSWGLQLNREKNAS